MPFHSELFCLDAKASEMPLPKFLTSVFDYKFPGDVVDRIALLGFKIRLPIFHRLLREWTCKAVRQQQSLQPLTYSTQAINDFLKLIDGVAKEDLASECDYNKADQVFKDKTPFVVTDSSYTLATALNEIGDYVDQKRRAANEAKNLKLAASYTLIQEEMVFAGVARASFVGIAYDRTLEDLQRQTYSILAVLALESPKDRPHLTLNMSQYILKASKSQDGLLTRVMNELLDGNLVLSPDDKSSLLLKAALLSLCSMASEVIITKKYKSNLTPNFISAAKILSVIFFKLALQEFVPERENQSKRYEYLLAIAKAYKLPVDLATACSQRVILKDKSCGLSGLSGVWALLTPQHQKDFMRYQLATYGEAVTKMSLSDQLVVSLLYDAINVKGFYLALSDLGDVDKSLEALAKKVMSAQSSPGFFQSLFRKSSSNGQALERWKCEFDLANTPNKHGYWR